MKAVTSPEKDDEIRPDDLPDPDRGSRENLENPEDDEDRVDETIDESFPASDPPAKY
ncbi:hypothetical protein HG264_17395 [Pseudomonas sp. gcc21]|uniref:hypothetical protein n=1 Tax=Pseudomonas sp. gcc21 TaxID=2726989 RepID=UPI001451CF63|nr:hypothetical protein [Pseudomonas sp. gcc21]QJD60525.1 hypothetical protein HG264_17395 [Pseudomonas sp. gcc21]